MSMWYKGRMTPHELGKFGEQLVGDYLFSAGFCLNESRYRSRNGEIDWVTFEGPYLVFVEVKTRVSTSFGEGVEAVDIKKWWRLVHVARQYMTEHNWKGPWRIDVVSLRLTSNGEVLSLHHLRDVTPY